MEIKVDLKIQNSLYNTKVKVGSVENNRRIQQIAFKGGYSWYSGGMEIQHETCSHLLFSSWNGEYRVYKDNGKDFSLSASRTLSPNEIFALDLDAIEPLANNLVYIRGGDRAEERLQMLLDRGGYGNLAAINLITDNVFCYTLPDGLVLLALDDSSVARSIAKTHTELFLSERIQEWEGVAYKTEILIRTDASSMWYSHWFGFTKQQDGCLMIYSVGGWGSREESNVIPYKGNEHLLGKIGDPEKKWKFKETPITAELSNTQRITKYLEDSCYYPDENHWRTKRGITCTLMFEEYATHSLSEPMTQSVFLKILKELGYVSYEARGIDCVEIWEALND